MWRFQVLVYLLITCHAASSQIVDLTGPGCDQGEYRLVNKDTMITIFGEPRYNAQAIRDHCDVSIRALEGRRIQYLIEKIQFHECGIEIYIYDIPGVDVSPARLITCSDNSKIYTGKTRYNEMRIRLRKTTPQSRNFEFQMKVKDDRGPSIEYEGKESNYVGEGMDPGAIVGMAIAGAIVILALILIAIYLCIRARNQQQKEPYKGTEMGESSVYTSGNSQVLFASSAPRYPKGRYGSMEDIRSTASSQDKAAGAYANPAYTKGPGEKKHGRPSSLGRTRGQKTGFSNNAFDGDTSDMGQSGDLSWEEGSTNLRRGGEGRRSRKEDFEKKPMKSAMKKKEPPVNSKVNTQPLNGILKSRNQSPSRSHTSSTEGSQDVNNLIYGYKHSNVDHPNVRHKPVLERKRSRSGTRSNRSGSSGGGRSSTGHHHRRSQSEEKKKPKANSRMYGDVFIDEPKRRSGSRSRSRSRRSDRTSDSLDSESSATTTSYSKKVSMNPGGKRVHIKGEETDI